MLTTHRIIRPLIFSALLFLFAIAHTLFLRLKLPAYGPKIGTYLDDLSYAMLVALILFIIFNLPSILRKISLFVFVFTIQFLVFGEWWNFEFYRDYIRYASLGHAADFKEIARGFQGFDSRFLAIGGSIVFFIVAFLLERKAELIVTSAGNLSVFLIVFLLAALIPTVVYTKFYIESQIENWQTSAAIPLNYKNPVLQLLREKFIDKAQAATVTAKHIEAVKQLYGKNNTNYPFYNINLESGYELNANKNSADFKNIIFITLESVRKYETIPRNGIDLTPNLNRISKTNFTPSNYYANSNQTIKAEIALLCGTHDFLIGSSISAGNNQQLKTNCLPNLLKQYGYKSYWFHGAESQFFNRDQFLPIMGFDALHDQQSIESDFTRNDTKYALRHWGVEDAYTFDYAFDYLEKTNEPFLAEILTVSNHHPFIDLDKGFDENDLHPDLPRNFDDIYNRYQHLIYYTDKALGQFWKKFEQSKLYENTIVVISGDHGIWLFPDESVHQTQDKSTFQYEAYLRLPLTIYFPDKVFSGPVNMTMSQVDVPELLMNYLDLNPVRAFQSNLDQQKTQQLLNNVNLDKEFLNPVFSSIGDNFYYRNGSQICYPPLLTRKDCDDYLYRCIDDYNQLKTDKQCISIEGDILENQSVTNSLEPNMSSANAVVDYFRKSIYFGSLPGDQIIKSVDIRQ